MRTHQGINTWDAIKEVIFARQGLDDSFVMSNINILSDDPEIKRKSMPKKDPSLLSYDDSVIQQQQNSYIGGLVDTDNVMFPLLFKHGMEGSVNVSKSASYGASAACGSSHMKSFATSEGEPMSNCFSQISPIEHSAYQSDIIDDNTIRS